MIGVIPVATALASGTRFGVEATVGLLLVVLGLFGLMPPAFRRRS